MSKTIGFFLFVFAFFFSFHANAQNITYTFLAGDLSGKPDRFGNVYTIGPSDAIFDIPIGDPALGDVLFEEDGLWTIWPDYGSIFLISHAPGFFEDAPELTAEITVALGGKYEVIFEFLDSDVDPDTGPIFAALGDDELVMYSDANSTRATGGTGHDYPIAGGVTGSAAYRYSVSLGIVEVEEGGVIKVRIDDVPGDQYDLNAGWDVGSTFQSITLKVLELSSTLKEIQVSPGVFEWYTDVSGNQFRTWPVNEAAYPAQEDWLTTASREDGSGKWNILVHGLGPYGPILESFPSNGNDAMPLRTSVRFAEAGTYNYYLNIGDTAAADPQQNIDEPNPIQFAIEGQEMITYVPDDGVFKGTPGYNDYEALMGEITVEAGEQVDFVIDDAPEFENVYRSVYLGMRFELQQIIELSEVQVSPGLFEWTTDLGGNRMKTWPQDESAYPNLEDWLTTVSREDGSGKWHTRDGLGPFGPILESFPENGNDAMPLRTSVEFSVGGVFNVYVRVGDIGAADPDENLESPTPLKFGLEGQELKTFGAWDGEFLGTPGYNDYEVLYGEITVADGEQVNFIIDDATDYEGAERSVYLGLRLEKTQGTPVENWSLY